MAHTPCELGMRIGQFGMSDVYKVRGTGGWRAVKVSRGDSLCAEAAITNEARTYETIGPHPNIATYYGHGRIDDRFCIELEYLDESYFCETRQGFPADEQELIRVAKESAAGLAHVHAMGYVHRDIKPTSLWLGGTSKLFDFGLTERVGRSLARRKFAPGTPAYASIDRLLGGPVSFRDDIFALGLTLYAYHTRAEPFAFVTDYILNGFDKESIEPFLNRWTNTYEGLAQKIEECDCSRTFKSLLKGLIHCLGGAADFPNGSAVVDYVSRYCPDQVPLSFQ